MAWAEWEQLKADAVERHAAQMRLDQLPADPGGSSGGGGGTGTLKHSRGPWTRAARTADDLETSTRKSRAALSAAHGGSGRGAEGLASLGVLKSVLASWEKRLDAVRDECSALEPKLRQVADGLCEVDAGVAAKADAVKVAAARRGE